VANSGKAPISAHCSAAILQNCVYRRQTASHATYFIDIHIHDTSHKRPKADAWDNPGGFAARSSKKFKKGVT